MNHPIAPGTTTGIYKPSSAWKPARHGADDHLRIASLLTGNAPSKPVEVITAPPTTIKPRTREMISKQVPAKSSKSSKSGPVKTDWVVTDYKPDAVDTGPVSDSKVNGLEITNDAFRSNRYNPKSKYGDLFESLKIGQCIKCPADVLGKIDSALTAYIKRNGIDAKVKTTKNYGDGMARVWMLAPD